MAEPTITLDKAIAVFKRWVQIAHPEHYDLPVDIDHSALLIRLLSGGEPYPAPPPKSFSYPWYDLLDTGFDDKCEVHGPYMSRDGGGLQELVINQHRWPLDTIVEDDAHYIVTHGETKWRVQRVNDDTFGWTIERMV